MRRIFGNAKEESLAKFLTSIYSKPSLIRFKIFAPEKLKQSRASALKDKKKRKSFSIIC